MTLVPVLLLSAALVTAESETGYPPPPGPYPTGAVRIPQAATPPTAAATTAADRQPDQFGDRLFGTRAVPAAARPAAPPRYPERSPSVAGSMPPPPSAVPPKPQSPLFRPPDQNP